MREPTTVEHDTMITNAGTHCGTRSRGFTLAEAMMAVVVLGGLGSMKGCFYAAYILGFAEALIVFLVPMGAFLKGSVALSIMVLVLLVRPEGLCGIAFEEER